MDSSHEIELTPETVEIIRNYQAATPRYTSYPTADHFHPGFGAENFLQHIRSSNSLQIPALLSLYVHVPFCHSLCYYCGCNKVVTQATERAGTFIQALVSEFDRIQSCLDADRLVDQIHFGGGTPNWLNIGQLSSLMNALERRFALDWGAGREFSMEIDPRYSTPEDIRGLANLGFNRLSFGVQDLNSQVQQAVNRVCSAEHLEALVKAARSSGIESVSFDLIYGLPHQTSESFANTIKKIIELRPDRLSLFLYAHLATRFKAQRLLEDHRPNLKQRLLIYLQSRHGLLAAGYDVIGMDHFALAEDRLSRARRQHQLKRNFQGYSVGDTRDLLGFGPSAISALGHCYAQNAVALAQWQSAVASNAATVRGYALNEEDLARRDIIETLMCYGRIDLSGVRGLEALGGWESFWLQSERALQQLADDGLVQLSKPVICTTALGQLLIRSVASVFDGFLQENNGGRFSQAI